MFYLGKLRRNPPRSICVLPPWLPIRTFAAAGLLNVHEKTLLEWHRAATPAQDPIDSQSALVGSWTPSGVVGEDGGLGRVLR